MELTSGPMAARAALSKISDWLVPLNLSGDFTSTVELVLAETINNIVEHAYPEGTGQGPIRLCCWADSDHLHFDIEDEGKAMPDGLLPAGDPARVDVDMMELPEGGFGWFLIRKLADEVTYDRVGSQNHLRVVLAIS